MPGTTTVELMSIHHIDIHLLITSQKDTETNIQITLRGTVTEAEVTKAKDEKTHIMTMIIYLVPQIIEKIENSILTIE